jgi:hypothetical protein
MAPTGVWPHVEPETLRSEVCILQAPSDQSATSHNLQPTSVEIAYSTRGQDPWLSGFQYSRA